MCVVLPVALVDPSSKKKRSLLKFGEKIRKNTENSEKYFGKFGKILWKIRKNTPENSEKYFGKFGKILSKIRIPDAKSLFPTMLLVYIKTR